MAVANRPRAGVHPGELTVYEGLPVFKNPKHPHWHAVHQEMSEASQRFNNHPDLVTKLDEFSARLSLEEQRRLDHIVTAERLEGILHDHTMGLPFFNLAQEHAPEELENWLRAHLKRSKMEVEIREAQVEYLKNLKELPKGLTQQTLSQFIGELSHNTETIREQMPTGFWLKHFETLTLDGPMAALKGNFGLDAFRQQPIKTFAKVGGVVLGAAMVYDGLFHAQREGKDGEPEPRSWVKRLLQVGVGGAVGVGSALHGRH